MKKIGYLGAALALMLALSAAQAEQRLTVVLDSCREMKASKAVDTAISYINTLMQGYAKNPTPPELAVTLYQIRAEPKWGQPSQCTFTYPPMVSTVGDGKQFFPDRCNAERESPFTLAATKKAASDFVFDWGSKGDGIILVSAAPDTKALNLGKGFHKVIIPARDAREKLDANQFTADIQSAFDEFMAIAAAAVTELKASATKVYTLGSVTFDISLEGTETAMVDFGDGNTEEYRAGNPIRHPFEKAGRYEVTARVSARDSGKSVKILVVDASATDLAVRPSRLTPAVDAEVSFVLHGAPSAAVQFGDDTPPAYAKGDSKGAVSIRHRYGEPGSYTLHVTPRNGARSFAPATLAVVVADEPHRLGLELKAARTKATLPDGHIEFHATLDNAVRAEIDYGDKTPVAKAATGRLVHDYGKAGTFEAKLTAWAADGTSDSQTCTVQIAEPAVPLPSCEFSPEEGTVMAGGELEVQCRFQNTESATASFSDAPEAVVSLNIGEDGTATIRHKFHNPGEAGILVTMQGNGKTTETRYRVAVDRPDESFGSYEVSVVRDEGPVQLQEPYEILKGEDINVRITKQRNADFTVDYGDGDNPVHGANTTHTYNQDGEYTVSISAKGRLTQTNIGKKDFQITVKTPFPWGVVVVVLGVLAAVFVMVKQLAVRGNRKIKVTAPGGKVEQRQFGRMELDSGVVVLVESGKSGGMQIRLQSGAASMNGRTLDSQPASAGRRAEIKTAGGIWIIETA